MTPPLPPHSNDEPFRTRSTWRRIAWCEPFWVAAIGLLLLFPSRFFSASLQIDLTLGQAWLVLLLFLGWPVRRLAYGYFTRRTPLDWPLLLIIVWLPVNLWASTDQALSWNALGYLLLGMALYFAVLNWPPAQRRPQIVAWLLLGMGSALALAAPLLSDLALGKIFQFQPLDAFFRQVAAQVPGSANANVVAGTLVIIAPLAVALFTRQDWTSRRWPPLLCGLASLLMLIALVMTQSRTAYLAIASASVAILLLRWPKLWVLLPVIVIAGALVVWRIGLPNVLEGLFSGGTLNGLNGRLEIWSRALYAIRDFPLTGIGIGTFEKVIPILYPLFFIGPDVQITHAHNLFLQIGVDLGIPGLIAYVAMLINIFIMLAQTLRQRAAAMDWTLAAGACGGLLAMLIHGIFDAPVWSARPTFVPWLLIALAMLVSLRSAAQAQQGDAA